MGLKINQQITIFYFYNTDGTINERRYTNTKGGKIIERRFYEKISG